MDMKDFLNVLASKEPVPGGGACGYVAAVGMALGNMVLSLTTGRKICRISGRNRRTYC